MLLGIGSIGIVALAKPVRIEFGRRAGTGSQTDTIDIVLGNKRIDRSYVYLARCLSRPRFHKVLNQCLRGEHQPFEMLGLRHLFNEVAHACFALCQFHRTVFLPEIVVAQLRISLHTGLGLAFEHFVGNLLEVIFAHVRIADDDGSGEKIRQFKLCYHIIGRQGPFSVRQL